MNCQSANYFSFNELFLFLIKDPMKIVKINSAPLSSMKLGEWLATLFKLCKLASYGV